MRKIKLFEEYRAMGFQYSEPKESFLVSFSLDDDNEMYVEETLEETIKDILVENNIKYDSIDIDGWLITLDVRVYVDREVNAIMDTILKSLGRKKIFVDVDTIEIENK